MERSIMHVDCYKFYASVECLHHPEARDKPVVVGGDPEQRHGIVLTKNEIAEQYGIKTGEALWQAKQKCPGLIIFPPNFPLYIRFSRLVREILLEYTDQLEPFGVDECWIDVTGSEGLFGRSETLAKEIQQRIWKELGITVSIGASWNKVTAKLGSDYRKPYGLTMLSKSNYKAIVYPLPASDLLSRRCVIPSTGFFEWTKGAKKQKYLFRETGKALLYMAGFYNEFGGERRYVILTTDANQSVREIHNRMPVIVRRQEIEDWIWNETAMKKILERVPPILAAARA